MTTRRLCFPQDRDELALREQLGGDIFFCLPSPLYRPLRRRFPGRSKRAQSYADDPHEQGLK